MLHYSCFMRLLGPILCTINQSSIFIKHVLFGRNRVSDITLALNEELENFQYQILVGKARHLHKIALDFSQSNTEVLRS